MNKIIIDKKKLNTETFTFRLPTLLREELEKIALENKISLSEIVRYSLQNLVKNE